MAVRADDRPAVMEHNDRAGAATKGVKYVSPECLKVVDGLREVGFEPRCSVDDILEKDTKGLLRVRELPATNED